MHACVFLSLHTQGSMARFKKCDPHTRRYDAGAAVEQTSEGRTFGAQDDFFGVVTLHNKFIVERNKRRRKGREERKEERKEAKRREKRDVHSVLCLCCFVLLEPT